MSFSDVVDSQVAYTTNGMQALQSTSSACVDLFYKIGAMRKQDPVPAFVAAFAEDKVLALKIAQWARDVRGGAGEREVFRKILAYLEKNDIEATLKLLEKIPEIGRWDDLLTFKTDSAKLVAFYTIKSALESGNALCAKWMPRKGKQAEELRNFLGYSPKFYRKRLVELSKTVEQQMCKKEWNEINFSHVPSLAHSRYKKAFDRNTTNYAEYVASLVKGDSGVKVNAGAVYPYDVIKGVQSTSYNETESNLVIKQWEALENFIRGSAVLPLVDVSGSMNTTVGGNKNLCCMDVAVSLGLYCADKNVGAFKDLFLTFTERPTIVKLRGNIVQKIQQMSTANWGTSTNLESALSLILRLAVDGKVSQNDMPKTLLILSDMQFNAACNGVSAIEMIREQYKHNGYEMPKIVFWNLNSHYNAPVKFNEQGVALISGFSPAILKAVLKADYADLSPEKIMLDTVDIERYNLV